MTSPLPPSSFARHLPLARLSTHDPRIVQVLTSPPSHLTQGDFGLKAPLRAAVAPGRKVGEVRYVQVREQDRAASVGAGVGKAGARSGGGPSWREREHEVLLLKRWQEAGVAVRPQGYEGSSFYGGDDGLGSGLEGNGGPNPYERRARELRASRVSAATGNPSTSSSGNAAAQPPIPVSRFDRSSRRALPTDTTGTAKLSAKRAEDEVSALLSSASLRYSSSASRLPNYALLPEKDFQRLLDIVREHRGEFLGGLYAALGEKARRTKLQAACEAYDAQSEPQGSRPTLDDFPLEAEVAELRQQQAHHSSEGGEGDAERLLVDMFDLARSRVASVEASAYLRSFLSSRGLSDLDATSTQLPDVDVRINGRGAEQLDTDGNASRSTRSHPLGGLQYSQPDRIFSATLSPALPGRVIGTKSNRGLYGNRAGGSARDGALLVASGSRVFEARKTYSKGSSIYDSTGFSPRQGTGLWRLFDAKMVAENPSASNLVERRVSDKKAAWDRERGWSLAELGLGYVRASARDVLGSEGKKNQYAANFSGNETQEEGEKARAASAWNRLPGSPAWVGDRSFSEHEDAQRAKMRSSFGSRGLGGASGTAGSGLFGRGRYSSPNGQNSNAGPNDQLSGQLAAHAGKGSNRINVSRRRAQDAQGEDKSSADDDVSTLLGLGGSNKRS
ncbi:hypothetical protein BDZ90DRAFT_282221 [Jaminaea rosea]|uniref:Uncharacterized protein n=1 Tax=Jaminaea rosea TaxID=1569628 RepID=A0A316UI41_9BASI|nr:hypothetical protein BDZ90DRAFT_282221 [Jaminaea rosea]PWN24574.1 hypothetical protein BDZ90DRAFT_282221 [Jaminaea rosea]